jgi:hypothetical protein
VTNDGGATVTARGFVYSMTGINSNPLIGGSGVVLLSANGTVGQFAADASALTPSTSYSFRAFATNSAGTTYTEPSIHLFDDTCCI